MRKKLTLLISLLCLSLSFAFAQSVVKGKVTDKSGQPLPGVGVKVQGTTTATSTDINGSYTINAAPNASLIFTYVGFTTLTEPIANQSVVNVTLTEGTNNLNDVVVVGFGTQKKSVVTGAITRVKTSDIQDQQVTRLDQALQGRTSGVTVTQSSGAPGAAPQIRIRGASSINNSEPLYVIDGLVVINGGIDNLNPDAIESIEVLKDASAAIYGSRASNGVILVTTKKGKAGTPVINYNGYIGFQQPIRKVDLANATQYATLRNQAVTNDGGTAPFANPSSYGVGTNWQDEIFSNAMIQNHNLSVSGGSEKSTYYTSFGYLDQRGIILKDQSDYKRYSFTVNSNSKVKKWLTVGENLNYAYGRTLGSFNTNSEFGGPLSSALNLDPITSVLQTNSAIAAGYNQYAVRNSAGVPYAISPYVGNEITNPLAYAQTINGNYSWSHNLFGNVFAEIEPITGLKIRTQYNAKQAFYGGDSFTPLYYLNSNNSNTTLTAANRNNNRNYTYTWDNTISYSKAIGLHNFTVLGGTSAFRQSGVTLGTNYTGLPYTSFSQLSFNQSLSAANRVGYSGEDQPYTVASIFGRVTYDYDQKYLFSGIIRRDGSSRFGSNNVYGVFPSAQVGWVVTREKFFPKDSFVDFLKIRGSYGAVGNEQSLGAFYYTSVVGSGNNYVFGSDQLTIGSSATRPSNPDLKWESLHSTDLGFDAVIFKNLNVTFDLYRRLTKGMIQQQTVPGYTGYTDQPYANVGNLINKGMELELGYSRKMGDFGFGVNGNIAYNYNKILTLGNLVSYLDLGSFQGISSYSLQRNQAGHPVGSFYGFREVGIYQTQAQINSTPHLDGAKPGDFIWQDVNGDGKIDQADRTFLGSPLPKYTYGLTINANYKGFDLKIFGQGAWGNKVFEGYRRLDLPTANYEIAALNAWTPTNTNTNYPRLTDNDPNNNFKYPSNFYLHNGGYFRIRTAQIGYTVKKNWLQKIDVSNVRVYISSNNLATITGYKGYDPEVSGAIDRGVYPASRSFLVGLNVTL
ncbi:TonB-dependent receptor [Mucilaginibacter robiniae]|uniref:TonB-dependent receptor n=1 Tax=Mucilaginibacter robiniae TaxID=2728022 RepID=A0A7L5DWW0_9SPHI|nr:TonB-dependent receptor [Mucilaginibacter robiniae]QJD95515.1 TonB-dependent receptor [Mucilaginibacter robiniae]